MARQQLPPQITKVTLKDGTTRYQVSMAVVDTNGARRWVKRRFVKETDARQALAELSGAAAAGGFVARDRRTVEEACADWLAGRRRIRPTTRYGYVQALQPVRMELGAVQVQKLTKRQLDDLVTALLKGGLKREDGKTRKPWSPRSVNLMLGTLGQVLESELKQGNVVRNVAVLVDRMEQQRKDMQTFTPDEVATVLDAADGDRNGHAWLLALSGLRRGEIGGLRWSHIDFGAITDDTPNGVLAVETNRTSAGGQVVEGAPKSAQSKRILPLTQPMADALKAAKRRQAAERLALGEAYDTSGYVVCDEAGRPYHPDTLTDFWVAIVKAAGVRHIRLHDARHTCATTMHLQGVPIAVIAAWLGHSSASFTLATYAHSQPGALAAAAQGLGGVVSKRVIAGS